MDRSLEQSLVRIHSVDNSIVGIGFLIKNDRIVTCSHAINVAVGQPKDSTNRPDIAIEVDFPFVQKNVLLPATIVEWHPKKETEGDIAILKINSGEVSGVEPVKLLRASDYDGHSFTAYGCPRNFQEDGRWVEGKLQKFLPNGRVQAIGVSELGYFIEQGFSGSPVWDQDLGGVVGVVMSVDRSEDKMQASILPTNTLIRLYPRLPLEGNVYISYARSDGKIIARRIIDELRIRKLEVENLKESPERVISTGVENAIAMIVVLTPGLLTPNKLTVNGIKLLN